MPSTHDVVAFLRGIGETDLAPEDLPGGPARVDGVAPDRDAGPGQLAWLSEKHLAREPERLGAFGGALLLAPAAARDAAREAGVPAVPCRTPKLAFTRAVGRFFPELAAVRWPRPGEPPVSPDAVLAEGVTLGHGAVVGGGVRVGPGSSIGPNSCVANCTIGANVTIGANCAIGLPGFGYERDADGVYWRFPHVGRVIIEDGVEIGSNTCIDRGALGATVVRSGAKIDNLVHVAHNVVIGRNAIVIANSMLGGSAEIGDGAWVAPSVSLMNQAKVGERATLGMGAVVLKGAEPGAVLVGNPARPLERRGDG